MSPVMYRIRRQRGSIMVLTLLVVTFAVVIVGGFMRRAGSGKLHAAYEYQGMQAYYAAESGLNTVMSDVAPYSQTLRQLAVGAEAQLAGTTNVVQLDELGNPVDVVGTYRVTVKKLSDAGMYLFTSYGATPHAQRIASAEAHVVFDPYFGESDDSSMGAVGGMGMSVPGNSGLGGGNPVEIWYLFEDASLAVYGPLEVSTPNLQDRTINIINGRFLSTNNEIEFAASYPWLAGKQKQWTPGVFPNPLDEIRRKLETSLIGSSWTPVSGMGKNIVISGGQLRYTDKINDGTNITGNGVLDLQDTKKNSDFIDIGVLTLNDDLVLTANKPIWIHQIAQANTESKPEGHKLVIINDGSVKYGTSGSFEWDINSPNPGEYCPFPWSTGSHDTNLTLGAGSIIWTAGNITITGDLRPYAQRNDTVYLADRDNPISKDVMRDWETFMLLSRDGAIRFRLLKGRGIVYATGAVLGYFMRLHGIVMLANPFRPVQGTTFGIANMHVSYDLSVLDDFDLLKAIINQAVRLH